MLKTIDWWANQFTCMMKFSSVVSSSILCDSYIQSIVATAWQPIGPMLVSAPSPDPISQRHGSFFLHVIPCHQVERMQGISKQSTCLWSNPIIADLVESKIQRSQSAVYWNPDGHRIKTYLRYPSCCNLVWEWKDLNSTAGPLWLSVRPMTAILGLLWY